MEVNDGKGKGLDKEIIEVNEAIVDGYESSCPIQKSRKSNY